MKLTPARTFLLWLLAMLALASAAWNARFSADISFFLPAHPSAEQQVLVDQLREGAVSRLLMLGIEGGDAEQRAAVSRALRDRLGARPDFASVQNGDASSQDAARDFLFAHRYLLSPAVGPERFSVAGIEAAVTNSIELLASPAGLLIKPFLTRDPTGELVEVLGGLNAGSEPNLIGGVWASRDGERALLLAQTHALGSDLDGQQKAVTLIRTEFAAAAKKAGAHALTLQLSGPGVFAVKARETIRHEVTRLSLISLGGIVAVLLWVYRSPRLLGLSLLPMASGALAGVVAVSLVHDTVFGITVGFGAALIGEAVDYAIYYFVQSGQLGEDRWRERFWPTIRLGVLTSMFGFGALLLSGFPGLAQLGLYSLAGVLTAAVVTRFVLPRLAGKVGEVRVPARASAALVAALTRARVLRVPMIVVALAAAGYLTVQRDQLWLPNLSALSTTSEAEAEVDARLRADIGAPDARYLAVVTAPDLETALQAAERAGHRLDALIADGVIGGYDSPARFLPSAATQSARRASLPTATELEPRLRAALADSPLAAAKLGPFVADAETARGAPLLTRDAFVGTDLALAIDSLLLHGASGWSALLPLRPVGGEQGVDIPVDAVRGALAGSGVLFVDLKGEFDTLYGDYISEAVLLSGAGFLAIVALLAITLRSPRRLAAVLLPLVLAVAIIIAGLHAAGERLHLLHLVGMLLIIAVGSNYALFFDHLADVAQPDPRTVMSMAVAAATTAIGFGSLALSSVPVLHAVGVTVGPGAFLALLLSAVFASQRKA
jgi:predicted exporter